MPLLVTVACVLPPVAFCALVAACRRVPARTLQPVLHVQKLHNALMCLYSLYVYVFLLLKMQSTGRLDSVRAMLCESGDGAPMLWYASKYLEWVDTLILFAKGKKPSALHLFHHATAPIAVAANLFDLARPTPGFDIGSFLNGGVHAVMYMYYYDAVAYRDLRKMVTTIQIIQHVAVVGSCVAALCMEGCHAPVERYAVSIGLYAVYLVAFLAFYARTYASAPGPRINGWKAKRA